MQAIGNVCQRGNSLLCYLIVVYIISEQPSERLSANMAGFPSVGRVSVQSTLRILALQSSRARPVLWRRASCDCVSQPSQGRRWMVSVSDGVCLDRVHLVFFSAVCTGLPSTREASTRTYNTFLMRVRVV